MMDLDGTVLDATFRASPRTRTAIEAAEAAGIVCLIATGRMFQSARRIAATIGVTGPLICYQGGMVGDALTGEIFLHRPLEVPLAKELLEALGRVEPVHEHLRERRAVRHRGERRHDPLRADRRRRDARRRRPAHLAARADHEARHRRPPRAARPAARRAGRPLRRPGVHREVAADLPGVRGARGVEGLGARLRLRAARLHAGRDDRLRGRRERPRAARLGLARDRRGERRPRPPGPGRRGRAGRRRRRGGAVPGRAGRRAPGRFSPMLDLRQLRNDTDDVKAALARRLDPSILETVDAVLSLDERRRMLQGEVDAVRAERNRQAEEIGRRKKAGEDASEAMAAAQAGRERLAEVEEDLRAVSAELTERLLTLPNPPHAVGARGGHRGRRGDRPDRRRAARLRLRAEGPRRPGRLDDRPRARRPHVGLALRLPARRPRAAAHGTVRFAVDSLVRRGFIPVLPPVLVRESALEGTGYFPGERDQIYSLERDDLYLVGTSEVPLAALHQDEILPGRGAPPPLLRRLVVLPPRGRRRRQGHPRHLPHAPVREGRDVLVLPSRPLLGGARAAPLDRGGAGPGARPALPGEEHRRRATWARRRPRSTTSRSGSPARGATASSRRARTPRTTRRAACRPASGPRGRARRRCCTP